MKKTLKNYFKDNSIIWSFYTVLFSGSFFLNKKFNLSEILFKGRVSEDSTYHIIAIFFLILSAFLTPIIIKIGTIRLKNKYRKLH